MFPEPGNFIWVSVGQDASVSHTEAACLDLSTQRWLTLNQRKVVWWRINHSAPRAAIWVACSQLVPSEGWPSATGLPAGRYWAIWWGGTLPATVLWRIIVHILCMLMFLLRGWAADGHPTLRRHWQPLYSAVYSVFSVLIAVWICFKFIRFIFQDRGILKFRKSLDLKLFICKI